MSAGERETEVAHHRARAMFVARTCFRPRCRGHQHLERCDFACRGAARVVQQRELGTLSLLSCGGLVDVVEEEVRIASMAASADHAASADTASTAASADASTDAGNPKPLRSASRKRAVQLPPAPVDPRGPIVLLTIHGFGNRIRSLAAAWSLAAEVNRSLHVLWDADSSCGA